MQQFRGLLLRPLTTAVIPGRSRRIGVPSHVLHGDYIGTAIQHVANDYMDISS